MELAIGKLLEFIEDIAEQYPNTEIISINRHDNQIAIQHKPYQDMGYVKCEWYDI